MKGSGPPKRKLEEVTFLKELEETYKNRRFPNVEISKILTSKMIDQIKYKRRKLKLASEEASLQKVAQENGWIFTIVDISETSDTIPHLALAPFLGRKGVRAPIIELINNMYMDSKQLLELMEKRGSRSRFSEE
jgi:hypothetical protein